MHQIKSIITITFILIAMGSFSQTRNWKTETSKDGKATVKYELVKEGKRTHFYYIAQTTANVTFDELAAYFSNTANHKFFLESTPITEEVKKNIRY